MLFGASVRYNLDPFNQYDDDKIWRALDQVKDYSILWQCCITRTILIVYSGSTKECCRGS